MDDEGRPRGRRLPSAGVSRRGERRERQLRGLPSHDAKSGSDAAPAPQHPGRDARPSPSGAGPSPASLSQASTPLRGRHKLALIRDLAMGEWAPESLAQMHGLHPGQVSQFALAYAAEIQEVSAALSGTLDQGSAGLWLSKKQQRLAEYQQAIDDIDEQIRNLADMGIHWSRSHRDMFRARLDLYRQAADELGAYPQRTQAPARQGLPVQYIIDTEDQDSMT